MSYYKEYEELKDKADRCVISRGYAHQIVNVAPHSGIVLTELQAAIIADKGNLCFGYLSQGRRPDGSFNIKVYTD